MIFKYRENWPEIVEILKENNFEYDQIIFLIALLELDNDEGYELRKLESKGKSLKEKVEVYRKWIRNREFHYQNNIRRLNTEYMPFLEFVSKESGQSDIEECIKFIESELITKEIK